MAVRCGWAAAAAAVLASPWAESHPAICMTAAYASWVAVLNAVLLPNAWQYLTTSTADTCSC